MKTHFNSIEILKFIEENASENNPVSLSHLLNSLEISRVFLVKTLNSLFSENKIEISINRRDKEDLYVSMKQEEKNKKTHSSDLSNDLLFVSIELCSRILIKPDFEKFHRLTNNRFKDKSLLNFLKKCNAEFLDLKFLYRYVNKYLLGETPVCITYLGLDKNEIIDITDKINNNIFLLQNQELVEVRKERGGIYLSGVLSTRLVQLLKNEDIKFIDVITKKDKGLFFEIKNENIKPCTLFYNKKENDALSIISKILSNQSNIKGANVSILLHGLPGTGKTEFAYQLARNLKADIMQMNFSEIQSKWVGETEKNIRIMFDIYQKKMQENDNPIILLMNEADGLMNKRVNVQVSNDAFHNQTQTQLLELLEDFNGIIIATTNLYQNIDNAFFRRFLFHQKINMPDANTRGQILKASTIYKYMTDKLWNHLIDSEWSPAQLQNIERKVKQLETVQQITEEVIETMFLQDVFASNKKPLGFLIEKTGDDLSQNQSAASYIYKD